MDEKGDLMTHALEHVNMVGYVKGDPGQDFSQEIAEAEAADQRALEDMREAERQRREAEREAIREETERRRRAALVGVGVGLLTILGAAAVIKSGGLLAPVLGPKIASAVKTMAKISQGLSLTNSTMNAIDVHTEATNLEAMNQSIYDEYLRNPLRVLLSDDLYDSIMQSNAFMSNVFLAPAGLAHLSIMPSPQAVNTILAGVASDVGIGGPLSHLVENFVETGNPFSDLSKTGLIESMRREAGDMVSNPFLLMLSILGNASTPSDNSGSRVRGIGTNVDVNPINIGNNTFIFTQFGINSFEAMPFINVDASGVNLSAFDISFVQNDLTINSPIWRRNQPTSPNANNQTNTNRPPNTNNQASNNRPTNANNQTSNNRQTNANNQASNNRQTNTTNTNRPNATSANRVAEQNRIANTITLKRIKRLYPDIRKKRTLEALVDAHRAVLAHGQHTGNELLIVINSGTGETVLSQSGIINNVTFDLERIRNQRVILVHNHPNDMAFSPADINTFNRRSDIDYISIQTPSGRMYSLSRGDGRRASTNDMNIISIRFEQLRDGKSLSTESTIELNRRIANLHNWNLIID